VQTPAEYGAMLARHAPPLTAEQIEQAAQILASVIAEKERGAT
jgi:hypothetical protein